MDRATAVEQQRRSWDHYSAGWGRWDDLVSGMLGPITGTMLRLLEPVEGGRHLDVACGTGEPGLEIAAGPSAHVTMTDLSDGMLDQARHKAERRGLGNVEFHRCGADDLPFDDDSFDTVTCRLGLMFFPDPVQAATELRRVLKPGGRICAAVWAEPEGNPWATVPMAAIASELDVTPPPADGPGLFRFSTPGAVAGIFERAGYVDVREMQMEEAGDVESAGLFWRFTRETAGPIVAALDDADDAAEDRVAEAVLRDLASFSDGDRLRIPIRARCAVATNPA